MDLSVSEKIGKGFSRVSSSLWGAAKGLFTVGTVEVLLLAAGVPPINSIVSTITYTAGAVAGVIDENKKVDNRYS